MLSLKLLPRPFATVIVVTTAKIPMMIPSAVRIALVLFSFIAAIADSSSEGGYVPDKDGFVEVVFVVEDDLAKAIQVKTGIQSETHIEIVEGLSEGDEIVTGSFRAISQTLQNHSQVEVKNENQQK